MSDSFLHHFLRAARIITETERGLAVNTAMQIVTSVNIDPATIESAPFLNFALDCMQQARDHKEAIITNNTIRDISEAPNTNTGFADMRAAVALPVGDYGAVYLDQYVKYGIVKRETLDRLMRVIAHITSTRQEDSTEQRIIEMYEHIY